MPKQTCVHCRHFLAFKDRDIGLCERYPPQMFPTPHLKNDWKAVVDGYHAVRPHVNTRDTCGEWRETSNAVIDALKSEAEQILKSETQQ